MQEELDREFEQMLDEERLAEDHEHQEYIDEVETRKDLLEAGHPS